MGFGFMSLDVELREESEYSGEEGGEEEEYFRGVVGPLRATVCEFQDTSPVGSYWLTKLIIVLNILVALFTGGIFFIGDEFAYRTYPSAVCSYWRMFPGNNTLNVFTCKLSSPLRQHDLPVHCWRQY